MPQPEPFRVIITGSRTWRDNELIRQAIRRVLDDVTDRPIVWVHGACKVGADAAADCYLDYLGADIKRYPAEWRRLGKGAGFIRNAAMVEAGADLVLAFVAECAKPGCVEPRPHHSHGASHTVGLASAAGIPVRPYEQIGGHRDAA